MTNDENLNQGHGHVTPRQDGYKARCGGPGLCVVCSAEKARIATESAPAAGAASITLERFTAIANEGGNDTWVDDPEGELVNADNAIAYAAQQREAGRQEGQKAAVLEYMPKVGALMDRVQELEAALAQRAAGELPPLPPMPTPEVLYQADSEDITGYTADQMNARYREGFAAGSALVEGIIYERDAARAQLAARAVGGVDAPASFSCAKAEADKYSTTCDVFCGNHATCITSERKFPNEHDSRVMFEAWVKGNQHRYYQEPHRLREIIQHQGPGYKDSWTHNDYQGWCAAWKAFSALLSAAPAAHTTGATPVVSAQAPVVAAPVGDGDEELEAIYDSTFDQALQRYGAMLEVTSAKAEQVRLIHAALTQQKG